MTTAAATWIGILGGLVVVLGAAVALIRWLRRHFNGMSDFIDDWNGEPARPGVPARAGVMQRLGQLEAGQARIEHELRPNSGQSLRDAVDRVDSRTARIAPDPQ